MRRLSRILVLSAGLTVLAACGSTLEQRAATGAITGAVVAGPVGAAVGGAAGAVVAKTQGED